MTDMPDLRSLADHLEIRDVLTRYATALDSGEWELLSDVFTADGVAEFGDLGGRHEGVGAIAAFVRSVLEGLDASQHLIGNESVLLDGDRAKARCYFQAQHFVVSANGGNCYLVGGTYEDELVRTPAGWRISLRRLVPTWFDGNAGVVAEAAARAAGT